MLRDGYRGCVLKYGQEFTQLKRRYHTGLPKMPHTLEVYVERLATDVALRVLKGVSEHNSLGR